MIVCHFVCISEMQISRHFSSYVSFFLLYLAEYIVLSTELCICKKIVYAAQSMLLLCLD